MEEQPGSSTRGLITGLSVNRGAACLSLLLPPLSLISSPGKDCMPSGTAFGSSQEIHLDPNSARHTRTSLFVYCWTEHKDGCALSNALRTGTLPSALPFSLPFPREQESSGSRLVVQSGVMVTLENISLY